AQQLWQASQFSQQLVALRQSRIGQLASQQQSVQAQLAQHPQRAQLGVQLGIWREQLTARQQLSNAVTEQLNRQQQEQADAAQLAQQMQNLQAQLQQAEAALLVAETREREQQAALEQLLAGEAEAALREHW